MRLLFHPVDRHGFTQVSGSSAAASGPDSSIRRGCRGGQPSLAATHCDFSWSQRVSSPVPGHAAISARYSATSSTGRITPASSIRCAHPRDLQLLGRVRGAEPTPRDEIGVRRDGVRRVDLQHREPAHDVQQGRRTRRVEQLRAHRDPTRIRPRQLVHGSRLNPRYDGGPGKMRRCPPPSAGTGRRLGTDRRRDRRDRRRRRARAGPRPLAQGSAAVREQHDDEPHRPLAGLLVSSPTPRRPAEVRVAGRDHLRWRAVQPDPGAGRRRARRRRRAAHDLDPRRLLLGSRATAISGFVRLGPDGRDRRVGPRASSARTRVVDLHAVVGARVRMPFVHVPAAERPRVRALRLGRRRALPGRLSRPTRSGTSRTSTCSGARRTPAATASCSRPRSRRCAPSTGTCASCSAGSPTRTAPWRHRPDAVPRRCLHGSAL